MTDSGELVFASGDLWTWSDNDVILVKGGSPLFVVDYDKTRDPGLAVISCFGIIRVFHDQITSEDP